MGRQSLKSRASRRDKLSVAALTANRSQALEQMNPALQRKMSLLEKSVNDLRAENLRYYHQIGKICRQITDDPGKYVGLDGTPGIKLVEKALSTQSRTLRKALTFARLYDNEQLDSLIDLSNEQTEYRLNWGHVSFLLTLHTPEQRQSYAEQAVSKMLDPPALHDLIKRRTQRSGGHGRKHEMPKTINGQIEQILRLCRQWASKNDEVWNGEEESVYGNLLAIPPSDMEPDMVTKLDEVATLMTQIAAAASDNVRRTREASEYIQNSIVRREQELAAISDSGRQSRSIDLDGPPRRQRRRA